RFRIASPLCSPTWVLTACFAILSSAKVDSSINRMKPGTIMESLGRLQRPLGAIRNGKRTCYAQWEPFQENLAIDRVWFLELRTARFGYPEAPQIMLVQWSMRFSFRRRRSPAPIPIWRAAFGRAPHFRLPLPVISATAPGVFVARRVWCRTSSCRSTHFDFPVGVGDSAMVPGVFSAPPVPVKDSLRGVPTLPARWISFELAQAITSRAETFRESSFHEAMILAFVF